MLALVFSDIDGGGGHAHWMAAEEGFGFERLFLAPRGFGGSVVSRTRHLLVQFGLAVCRRAYRLRPWGADCRGRLLLHEDERTARLSALSTPKPPITLDCLT